MTEDKLMADAPEDGTVEGSKVQRFRVDRTGEVLSIRGDLGDLTDLQCLEGMVSENTEFDALHFSGCTWIGTNNFFNALKKYNRRITLRNLSYFVYQYMRLHRDFNTVFLLESVFLPFCDDNFTDSKYRLIERSVWTAWALDQDYFMESNTREYSTTPCPYIIPDRFISEKDYVLKMPLIEASFLEEWSFLAKSIHFFNISFGLSGQIILGVRDQLESIVENIRIQIENVTNGLVMLRPNFVISELASVPRILGYIHSKANTLIEHISRIRQNGTLSYMKFLRLSWQYKPGEERVYRDIYLEYAKIFLDLHQIGHEMENFGYNVTNSIYALDCSEKLREELNSIEDLEGETLAQLRERMMIMDIMSEDSWPDTKDLILVEISEITNKVEKSGVTLQGLDLARQVLDHRSRESQVIESEYNHLPWQQVRKSYIAKICEKLVTDQEKCAFDFFLNDHNEESAAQDPNAEVAQPGDALFF